MVLYVTYLRAGPPPDLLQGADVCEGACAPLWGETVVPCMAHDWTSIGKALDWVFGSYRGARGSPGGTPREPPRNSTPETNKPAKLY